jgi:hypothetical protein
MWLRKRDELQYWSLIGALVLGFFFVFSPNIVIYWNFGC